MYGFEDKLLSILISLMLGVQAYVIRRSVGTFLHPAALFSIIWFFYTIIPLVMLFDVPINALSVFYIFICATAFYVSSIPFNWRKAYELNKNNKPNVQSNFIGKFMFSCLFMSSVLSLIFSTLTMVINGWRIEEIFTNLLFTSGRFAVLRGNEGMNYGLIGILGIFFTYLSASLGGLISHFEKKAYRTIVFSIISFLPAVYAMVIQSSKLILFVAASFYIGALLLGKVFSSEKTILTNRNLSKILISLLAVSPFIILSFISREHRIDITDLQILATSIKYDLRSYLFGQIYAFSDFFSYYLGMYSQSMFLDDYGNYGNYTFASLFQMFGYDKNFPPGLYLETGYYMDQFETNIFTIFRGLIYDFGGAGTILFFLIFGFILHLNFFNLLSKRKSWLSAVIFIVTVVFILMSYLLSAFMARYAFLNAFAMWTILLVNDFIRRRPIKL